EVSRDRHPLGGAVRRRVLYPTDRGGLPGVRRPAGGEGPAVAAGTDPAVPLADRPGDARDGLQGPVPLVPGRGRRRPGAVHRRVLPLVDPGRRPAGAAQGAPRRGAQTRSATGNNPAKRRFYDPV
ncbi:MAG: hypothetical protein AVDCRST_MAG64-830, partial [uncultured Phycisphaerae bacterium]